MHPGIDKDEIEYPFLRLITGDNTSRISGEEPLERLQKLLR